MYGGTQTEMQRLIKDAARLDKSIDANSMSFANIVKAINVVQTEMGITGTTAKEAGRTIEGSVNAMKSAWTNLVTGIADKNADLEGLVGDFVTTIVGDGTENNLGVLGNIMPAVKTALNGASTLVSKMIPIIVNQIPSIIKDNLPILTKAAVSIVKSLVDGISENQEMLVDTVFETVVFLTESFIEMLPQIVQLGLDLIVSLANGIAESLPELIPTIVDVILQIVDTLTSPDTLLNLVDACIAIILALADGLIDALPRLIEAVPVIIGNLVQAIIEAVPQLIFAAGELIWGLITGLNNPDNTTALLEGTIKMLGSIIKGIVIYYSQMFEKGKEIFTSIKDGFMKFIDDPKKWGTDLIDNFVGGIKEKWNKLKDTISNVAQSVKDFLGFSEPKKGPLSNFHTYAPDMMDLFAKGIRDNEDVITDQIEKSFDFGERTMKFGAEYGGGYGVVAASGAFGGTSIGVVNINIEGYNAQDDDELAEMIAEKLQVMTERKGAVFA